MRLSIVTQQGAQASGAEYALLNLLSHLPPETDIRWFFFEAGAFVDTLRGRSTSVEVIEMPTRLLRSKRTQLPLAATFDALDVARRLKRAIARDGADVVLTNSVKAHFIGAVAARLAGIPCVTYLHDIVEGRAGFFLRVLNRCATAARITCSQAVKNSFNLPRTTVIHPTIDPQNFHTLPDRSTAKRLLGLSHVNVPIVGLIGRFARSKGQDRFVRIASALLRRIDAHFLIVGSPFFSGDAQFAAEVTDAIAKSGLAPHFSILPWQTDVRPLYAALDIACNCSDREPFGLTSLEALASGVPIVCFADAGVCEIFEHQQGGLHIPVGDERAFTDALSHLLSSPQSRDVFASRAQAVAATINTMAAADAFRQILDAVAKPPASSSRGLPQSHRKTR